MPISSSYKVHWLVSTPHKEDRVCTLINENTKGWNMNLVHQIFQLEEAFIISNIPLRHLGAPDRIYWLYSKTGLFLIGSAYHLEVGRNSKMLGESSIDNQIAHHWNTPCNLKVPSSIKHFMWQVCHNILPTKLNLVKKKITDQAD